uniref:Coiled-coil domain containing 170 n=1 Tax=Nothobranchius korthausae TaxID=1143690 RepID=A0A1A8FWH8_9TELE
MRNAVLEESVKSYELECKVSRETVLRLEKELDQERRKVVSNATDLQSLKKTLGESLEASRRVIEAARRESHCLEKQVEDLQAKAQAAEEKLQLFLERMAKLLQGKSESFISPSEGDILQELDKLCNKYEELLEPLSETMKVNSPAEGLGFEIRLKLVLSRTEQLFRQEASALIESRRLTFNLQQKVQSQKNLLDGKELQIQLLRRKLLEMEENTTLLETRKLKKKIEHLQGELRATKLSNSELRAQLAHADELKVEGRRIWIQGPSGNAFSS